MDNTKKYFERKKRFEKLEKDGIYEKICCNDQENLRYSKLFLDELPFEIVREDNDDLDKNATIPLDKNGKINETINNFVAKNADEDIEKVYRNDDAIYCHYKYIECINYKAERDMRILCGIKKISLYLGILIVLMLILLICILLIPQITISIF